MNEVVRIGFIGAGGIARAHASAFAKIAEAKITAVTDAHRPAAEEFAEPIGAQVFDSPNDLAGSGLVDALYILIPPFAHGVPEKAALDHKLPFFVEKPLGLDESQIKEFAAEIERSGLMSSVGYMNRYRQGVQRVRKTLDSEPGILAYGGWWGGSPGSHPWWTDHRKSGGQFHEQVTHTVDLARYFLGDADEVFAMAAKGFNKGIPGYSMDDAVTVAIRFKGGAVANLMASVSSNAGGGVSLILHSLNHNFSFTGWEHSLVINKKGEPPEEVKGEDDIFAIEDRVFVQAVKTGDRSQIQSNYPDGAKSTLLSLAANQSIASGKPVAL